MHPGDIVAGKYRVARILGRSRGLLLEARHTEFDQRVVIRLMSPALCDAKELEKFRREARTLSKLESEHSARIIDVGSHSDGSFYLVRQYLDGVDLATQIRNQGALRLDEAVLYLLQAGEVVQECHANNIVLRELQPSHLFLTRARGEQHLKVIDFGTAKLLKEPGSEAAGGELTSTVMFGMSAYSSPEILRKTGGIDHRTDVWTLGCVLYEMLSGVPAFQGELAELLMRITREDPVPLSRLRPDLPQELDQIIGWALAKDPASRFSSVYALAHALRPYASAAGNVLVDRIGRIAHSAPAAREEASISPTSPLAKGNAGLDDDGKNATRPVGAGRLVPKGHALLDDDEESGSTVIMQAPSESDFERTAFMASPAAGAPPQRASVVPPIPQRGSMVPVQPVPGMPLPARQSSASLVPGLGGIPGALGSVPGANGTAGGLAAPAALVSSTGGYPSQTATGQHQRVKQKTLAFWAIGAACVAVPTLVLGLVYARKGSGDAAISETPTSLAPPSAETATPAPGGEDAAPVAGGDTRPAGDSQALADMPRGAESDSGSQHPTTSGSGAGSGSKTSSSGTSVSSKEPGKKDSKKEPDKKEPDKKEPEKAPSGGGTGKLVAVASGGNCSFTVDGAPKGTMGVLNVTVPVGAHTVSCAAPGKPTRSQRVTVADGKPSMVTFKVGG